MFCIWECIAIISFITSVVVLILQQKIHKKRMKQLDYQKK